MASKKADRILIASIGLLLIIGIIILASTSAPTSYEKYGDGFYILKRQIFFAILPGIIIAFLISQMNLNWIKRKAPLFMLIAMVLMVLVFVPQLSIKSGTSARWIDMGPISFQPSEFLKLSFILYLASWLESRSKQEGQIFGKKKIDFNQNLYAFIVILLLITILLAMQSDIGTWGVIVATGGLMYFFSGTPIRKVLTICLVGIILLVLAVHLAPYRMQRITSFLNPEADPLGSGYQMDQARIAIGSGRIFGLGLGMSQQKYGLLPQPSSDSIFAILAEETGFMGSVSVIILFLIFLWRGFRIGKRVNNKFSKLTAFGITSWIFIQQIVNIGAIVGLMPLTGIPLPFISHGGTAILVEMAAVGILVNISKQ